MPDHDAEVAAVLCECGHWQRLHEAGEGECSACAEALTQAPKLVRCEAFRRQLPTWTCPTCGVIHRG